MFVRGVLKHICDRGYTQIQILSKFARSKHIQLNQASQSTNMSVLIHDFNRIKDSFLGFHLSSPRYGLVFNAQGSHMVIQAFPL